MIIKQFRRRDKRREAINLDETIPLVQLPAIDEGDEVRRKGLTYHVVGIEYRGMREPRELRIARMIDGKEEVILEITYSFNKRTRHLEETNLERISERSNNPNEIKKYYELYRFLRG